MGRIKCNKRSLKKRISKTFSMLNFFSLGIMLITMLITLGVVFKVFSSIIVKNAASDMSNQLKIGYLEQQKKGKVTKDFKEVTPYYEHLFKTLGESYKVLTSPKEKLKLTEGADTEATMSEDMSGNMNLIDYNIWNNNKLIYDSLNHQGQIKDSNQKPKQDSWLIQKLISETSTTDSVVIDNKQLFVINVKLNPFIIIFGYLGIIFICVMIFLIVLIISKIIARMLSNIIVKPLSDLDIKMKELADGNIEAAIKTEIKFKRPIFEVQNLANHTNIIMSRMSEYVDTLANQNTELEAQNITLKENSATVEDINKVLDNKNTKLKNIFNNVEQGFLTFGSDLKIQSEYSLVCEQLFSRFITGESLSTLLNPKDMNMQNFIDDLFTKIFISSNYHKKIYISLLPEEVTINNKVINLSYKVVKNEVNDDIW